MYISNNWINDYVNTSVLSPEKLVLKMTLATAEVEDSKKIGGRWFNQVKSALVEEVKPHPDADHLRLAVVFDGANRFEVVCGAPNLELNQMVLFAPVGTALPGGNLKKTAIRGVESCGMICAEDELGIGTDHTGIIVLPSSTPAGVTLEELIGGPDTIIEIDNKSLTHRPDLWGHRGLAREVAAFLGQPLRLPQPNPEEPKVKKLDPLRIEIECPDLCPRYSAIVVDKLEVRPSPPWMQQRLRSVGLRPINNLVDVTNYILMEYGQPMHAFDRRMIEGDLILVRRADSDEHFVTLDGNPHVLKNTSVVIADRRKAVALGGVMGGRNSEVLDDTACVVLESANFNATCIRRTANRHNLRTDSAVRFEKGQDPCNTVPALWRALELLRLTCPEARLTSQLLDVWPNPPETVEIRTEFARIRKYLGAEISDRKITDILESLGFMLTVKSKGAVVVRVPSWRSTGDVSIEADLVEEIGRMYGYDNIVPEAPTSISQPPVVNQERLFERKSKTIWSLELGYSEVGNYSFSGKKLNDMALLGGLQSVKLKNPVSSEYDRMRTSLVPHILRNVSENLRYYEHFKLYEIGRSYHPEITTDDGLAAERRWLVAAQAGDWAHWLRRKSDDLVEHLAVDKNEAKALGPFLAAKTDVQNYLTRIANFDVAWRRLPEPPPFAHPGRQIQALLGGKGVAFVCEVHPKVLENFEIDCPVELIVIELDTLFARTSKAKIFKPLRRYPVHEFELTVDIGRDRDSAKVEEIIQRSLGARFVSCKLMYLYAGEKIDPGKKAVTYTIAIGAEDHTLSPKEISKLRDKLLDGLKNSGMIVRGA